MKNSKKRNGFWNWAYSHLFNWKFIVFGVITGLLWAASAGWAFNLGYDQGINAYNYKVESLEREIQVLTENYESQIETLKANNEQAEYEAAHDADAEAVARVLYGVRYYDLSDDAKCAIIDVIKNRVDCSFGEFGDTILEVCNKDSQWQGYEENGEYLAADYQLAYNYLHNSSDTRFAPASCYWVVAKTGEVTVRTAFNSAEGNTWTIK